MDLLDRDRQWYKRITAVHYAYERVLYVTHEEYRDLRDLDAQRHRDDPPEPEPRFTATPVTAFDTFCGTRVVVDDVLAAEQLTRLGVDA